MQNKEKVHVILKYLTLEALWLAGQDLAIRMCGLWQHANLFLLRLLCVALPMLQSTRIGCKSH